MYSHFDKAGLNIGLPSLLLRLNIRLSGESSGSGGNPELLELVLNVPSLPRDISERNDEAVRFRSVRRLLDMLARGNVR